MKSLARDLLRIATFVPFWSPNAEKVIERAWWWSDEILAVVPPGETVDAITVETYLAPFPNIEVISHAWQTFERKAHLRPGDYVAVLGPDEVIIQPDALRPAIRHNYGKAVGARFYPMQDETHYRLDWRAGLTVWPFFPYQEEGRFFDWSIRLRGPHYTKELSRVETAAVKLLSYQFASSEQREYWSEEWGDSELVSEDVPTALWEYGGTL